jgi:tetratricopeptide (TPR) repeat protein
MNTPAEIRQRNIDNHYHMEKIAESSEQMVQLQAESLAEQARIGAELHSDLQGIAYGQEAICDELAGLTAETQGLRDQVSEVQGSLHSLHSMLDHHLTTLSQQLLAQQMVLQDIAGMLQNPRETAVLELRRRAELDLQNGRTSLGTRRDEWYDDALAIFQQIVEDPVGRHDYVAWFEVGWLLWKHHRAVPQAEEAFSRSVRLSVPEPNAYTVEGIRHFAYMRYLQGNHEGAWEAIEEGVGLSRDHLTLYDAARYAAISRRERQAVQLLEEAVWLQPLSIISVTAEPDFKEL